MGDELKTGSIIRHFTITNKIDSGGMAHVYLAYDKKLKRNVAIKVIKQSKLEDETIARFVSEARSLAQLNHTNITTIYDIEKINGNYYLIMEYLDGVNLKDYLVDNDLTFGECLRMYKELANAFTYIHKKKIIHRDIKPTNIIITNDNMYKIIDFGISKWMDDPKGFNTRTNFFVGSIRYLAPEVFLKSKSSSNRSDIYSLGLTMIFALLNRSYVEGKNMEEVVASIAGDEGLLPYHLEENLPDKFKKFLFYLIEKDPLDRCQSMTEVSDLLEELIPQIPSHLKAVTLTQLREEKLSLDEVRDVAKMNVIPKVSRSEMAALNRKELQEVSKANKGEKNNVKNKKREKRGVPLDETILNNKYSPHDNTMINMVINKVNNIFRIKMDMMKFSLGSVMIFLIASLYIFVFKENQQNKQLNVFNEKIEFKLTNENKVKLTESVTTKSGNKTLLLLLTEMNPSSNPKLYKSIKDLDDLFLMAERKNVEFRVIKNIKIKHIKNLIDSEKEELAYQQAISLNGELMDRIKDVERESVRGIRPGRLPASGRP